MKKFIFFLFFVLVVLSACTFSFGDDDEDDALGTLSLKIQSLVSPSSSGSSDRAIITADDVRLTLINPDGSEQGLETTKTKSQYKAKVKVGTGYKVRAEIINAANGPSPVVSGTSEVFAVESGKNTSVSVLCIPISPEEKTVGEEFDVTFTPKVEYWYSFIAESDVTEIALKKKKTLFPSMTILGTTKWAVYDEKGAYALKAATEKTSNASASMTYKNNSSTLKVKTQSGNLYYIGISKVDGPELSVTISIKDKGSNGESSESADSDADEAGEGTISVKVQ